MSDDITAIEVEARAYVKAYGDSYSRADGTRGAFEYLSEILNVIDELRSYQHKARAAAIEECAEFVESQEVLREHAGMSAVENMNFLLKTTAEDIRALAAPEHAWSRQSDDRKPGRISQCPGPK